MAVMAGPALTTVGAEAAANLRGQGGRSFLALLGIVIGSASIITLLNMGHIAQQESLKRFRSMGIDALRVEATPTGFSPAGFDRNAAEALVSDDPDILGVAPMAIGRDHVVHGARSEDAAVVGASAALFDLAGLQLAAGRPLTEADGCAQVAVLGAQTSRSLFGRGRAVGEVVYVGSYGFTVVGVLGPSTLEALSPVEYGRSVLVPLSCARRVTPGVDPTAALIRLRPGADGEAAGRRVSERLSRPGSDVNARSARSLVDAMNAQKAVHSRLLTAIGGISLFVGGIGVMNVMLMSMMQRRREIGVRLAVGARRRDIRAMFLFESGALAGAGGVLGALAGVTVTAAIAAVSGWDFALAVWTLPLGPGLSALVGMIFGLYPAIAASRLNPVDAIRAE